MKKIEVKNLVKRYGSFTAVEDISFYVESGAFFSFLGVNGAGKSTTIKMITALSERTSGSILLDGKELDSSAKKEIGVVFQKSLLDEALTVKQNLMMRSRCYDRHRGGQKKAVSDALALLDAQELMDWPYGKLSGGQRRRIDIARALVHKPSLLILDEPTTGLDPATRKSLWENLTWLNREKGMTLFLTTHYMEEAENADFIVMIDRGTIIEKATPSQLKQRYVKDKLILYPSDMDGLKTVLQEKRLQFRQSKDSFTLLFENTKESLPVLERCKGYIDEYEMIRGSLEEVFINLTANSAEEGER